MKTTSGHCIERLAMCQCEALMDFKATGPAWQTRIDNALKDWLRTHSPA